jgi:hypothetical protein
MQKIIVPIDGNARLVTGVAIPQIYAKRHGVIAHVNDSADI